MNINNTDIYESIKMGAVTVYEDADGIMVRLNDVFITDLDSTAKIAKILRENGFTHEDNAVCVKYRNIAEELMHDFSMDHMTPCAQWVYTKSVAPAADFSGIEPLHVEDAQLAADTYGFAHGKTDYILERIKEKRIWGMYIDGVLAGFAGFHHEGSLGMLEILPEYRRRGLGYTMLAFLIDVCLSEGRVAYGQVIDGNEASAKLQAKLGLEKCELPVIWVG